MRNFRTPFILAATAASLFFCNAASAIPVMDVQVEVLMAQGDDLKQALHLNANQQILWRQTAAKMHDILEDRRRRRDKMQNDLKHGLDDPHAELRDLAKVYDAEADLAYREDKQLRELFLTVNDALDDTQRQAVLMALNDQLQRLPDRGCDSEKSPDQSRGRGMGRRGGGGGGNGGPPGGAPPQQ